MLTNLYLLSFIVGGILLVMPLVGDVFDNTGTYTPPTPRSGVLSIQGATSFLLGFGATGTGLTRYTELRPAYIAAIAVVAAVVAALLLTRFIAYMLHGEDKKAEQQRSLHGLIAEVIVPINPVHGGKISARRGAQRIQMLARPFHASDSNAASWREVMIVDVRDGIALVSPVAAAPEVLR
jgi:membrane-bound ClpP family serine protease